MLIARMSQGWAYLPPGGLWAAAGGLRPQQRGQREGMGQRLPWSGEGSRRRASCSEEEKNSRIHFWMEPLDNQISLMNGWQTSQQVGKHIHDQKRKRKLQNADPPGGCTRDLEKKTELRVPVTVTSEMMLNLFVAFNQSSPEGAQWAASVQHLGNIRWSNAPVPTPNTQCLVIILSILMKKN